MGTRVTLSLPVSH